MPDDDLVALWEEHIRTELETRDVDGRMAAIVAQQIDWMLPGVPPTGRKVEIASIRSDASSQVSLEQPRTSAVRSMRERGYYFTDPAVLADSPADQLPGGVRRIRANEVKFIKTFELIMTDAARCHVAEIDRTAEPGAPMGYHCR
jgi:hypothetical protein